ncbi:Metaxin-2 [Gaertneriomyces sp. JEL0708]|nr:Metaxin-2 [Gaertneriomyces sp. JEL0708]
MINPLQKLNSFFPLHTHPAIHTPPPPPNVPTLYIFPRSKRHVTSLDAECVKYQAFLRFSEFRFAVQECFEEGMSPSGKLPFLHLRTNELLTGGDIIAHIKSSKGDLESRMTEQEKADMQAFCVLADTKLGSALNLTLWHDEQVTESITFPIYEGFHPWPLNKVVTRRKQAQVVKELLSRRTVINQDEIMAEAKECLIALECLLGDKTWFFGERASMLDATVFAYLHIILSLLNISKDRDVELRKMVLARDNLVKV